MAQRSSAVAAIVLAVSAVHVEAVAAPPPVSSPGAAVKGPRAVKPRSMPDWMVRVQEMYPAHAQREGIEGKVGVTVTVSEVGRVTDCRVSKPSKSPSLDSAACRGMLRYARFEPALDRNGQPVVSEYSTRIKFSKKR